MKGISEKTLIKIKDLKASVKLNNGDRLTTVTNANMELQRGRSYAIVGKSGSGKTSLISIIGLLNREYEGEYLYDGISISALKDRDLSILRANNIGFVFQQYNLIPSLSIRENIVLPMRLDGKEIDVDFFNEIVETLGLKDKLERFPSTLSGGQQQRVSIARALLTKPAIVLADEPTGNLDSVTSMEVVGLLKSCAARFHQTTLIVTHQEEVAQMADRVIRMSDGKIYTRDCNDC